MPCVVRSATAWGNAGTRSPPDGRQFRGRGHGVTFARLQPLFIYQANGGSVETLGLLVVIALALLIFGVVGGIAISKFLFFLLLVAGIIFLIGLFTRSTA
jgi:hypothetical protein